jgi:hypothetical protein
MTSFIRSRLPLAGSQTGVGRISPLASVLIALILAAGLVGCDSGSEEPEPRFSAELQTQAGSSTLNGTAGLTDGEQFEGDLTTALDLLPALLPDSVSVPDTLLTPESVDLQEATFVFLTTETGDGQGRTITLIFPGADVPDTGTYRLGDSNSPDAPADVPFVAAYSDYEDDRLLLAPAAGGTVTVNRSAPDQLEGEFDLSMAGAVEIQGISEADLISGTPFDSVRTRDAYEGASLGGSFVALRNADAQPLLPFVNAGGLALSSAR